MLASEKGRAVVEMTLRFEEKGVPSPLPEDRAADAHTRRAQLDRQLEIGAYSLRRRRNPVARHAFENAMRLQ